MVMFILTTWIKLSQIQCSQLSHGQMKVRNLLHKELLLELARIGQIFWKVLTVMGVMVVNGQKITDLQMTVLCGISMCLKFAHRQTLCLILNFFFI